MKCLLNIWIVLLLLCAGCKSGHYPTLPARLSSESEISRPQFALDAMAAAVIAPGEAEFAAVPLQFDWSRQQPGIPSTLFAGQFPSARWSQPMNVAVTNGFICPELRSIDGCDFWLVDFYGAVAVTSNVVRLSSNQIAASNAVLPPFDRVLVTLDRSTAFTLESCAGFPPKWQSTLNLTGNTFTAEVKNYRSNELFRVRTPSMPPVRLAWKAKRYYEP